MAAMNMRHVGRKAKYDAIKAEQYNRYQRLTVPYLRHYWLTNRSDDMLTGNGKAGSHFHA
ncbi:Hypothetical protein GbCGDNIH9_8436 [Granulibacter bethesdensis]|uniref:Uncharacterized protein n=1 Tax=Granulibacter bethesdensis TaxID=364410 RepID=A0AAC9K6V6_9PROT|nr:hypothetical protein [Granulibacter bethesdensis]APH53920.1 Hypothetical protein GbCGDNIH9_8436 [Granulibacter bethesdensis]